MTFATRLRNLIERLIPANDVISDIPFEPQPPSERLDGEVQGLGITLDAWLAGRRAGGRLYADLSSADISGLGHKFPQRVASTREAAARICRHEFDLLGSGPCLPRDRKRAQTDAGYDPIDWSLDPIARLRFPTGFRHTDWSPKLRPGMADIKWPWEIGRCQHWVTLGQAYRLTGDERFAREIVHEHADFVEANPIGIGMQYICTMDVAIRALNWALAFELIRNSPAFDTSVMAHAYRSLFDHGVFIVGNLENKYEVTSNHFLSNVVGLYGVGLVFGDLPQGRQWLAQCREWIEQEMRVQVLDDGADYESSIPYHRLVAELFLGGARLAELEGSPLSTGYTAKLRQMFQFHASVMRPDGLMPQVGDADDGRLHIFTDYGTWTPQDGRHLLGPAAAFFNEPAWLAGSGEDGLWEAAWWGLETSAIERVTAPATVASLFREAGVAVSRHNGCYLLVTNGRVGTSGFGNHKHNDLLSFEFHAAGVPLIVDPGSYLYTSDPNARNLFRSTRVHNTLQVDGVEQNDLRLDYLFRMFETSTVEHLEFDDSPAETLYRGLHTGYQRLPAPVTHERTFRLLKTSGALTITDRLIGSGGHVLRWHFHVAPGIGVADIGGGRFRLSAVGHTWELRSPAPLAGVVSDAWYSPSFGVRVPCQALDFTLQADIASAPEYHFVIGPQTNG